MLNKQQVNYQILSTGCASSQLMHSTTEGSLLTSSITHLEMGACPVVLSQTTMWHILSRA